MKRGLLAVLACRAFIACGNGNSLSGTYYGGPQGAGCQFFFKNGGELISRFSAAGLAVQNPREYTIKGDTVTVTLAATGRSTFDRKGDVLTSLLYLSRCDGSGAGS